jgi:prephenate dehydrogenase
MAGSHLGGYAASRPDLFEGATVVLTPTEATPPEALARARRLWEALGGRVLTMDPSAHDRAVASVSHLPHLVADALVDAVLAMDPAHLELAGRGFRDTTRVAGAVPEVWQEIFQSNREALGLAVASFRKSLDHLEGLILADDGEALRRELGRIRAARERLG